FATEVVRHCHATAIARAADRRRIARQLSGTRRDLRLRNRDVRGGRADEHSPKRTYGRASGRRKGAHCRGDEWEWSSAQHGRDVRSLAPDLPFYYGHDGLAEKVGCSPAAVRRQG